MAPRVPLAAPLVIGASGLVGGAFMQGLLRRGHPARGTYRTQPTPGLDALDLAADPRPYLDAVRPSLVILAGALTNVDYCESHPEETRDRNVTQLEPVVEWCARSGAPLVFFSTDYLFDGREGPYDEAAAPRPLNVYGRSKLEGERLVGTLERHVVLRITNVFDIGFDRKNFLVRVLEHLRDRRPLVVASDQLATPTYATWLAGQTVELIERGRLGGGESPRTLHLGCDEMISRVEFAARVAALVGGDASLVTGRPTAELAQAAPRPLRGGLRNDRLKRLLGLPAIPFETALRDLLPRMRGAFTVP